MFYSDAYIRYINYLDIYMHIYIWDIHIYALCFRHSEQFIFSSFRIECNMIVVTVFHFFSNKWNSIRFKIKRKTVNTVLLNLIWKIMEKYYSECVLITTYIPSNWATQLKLHHVLMPRNFHSEISGEHQRDNFIYWLRPRGARLPRKVSELIYMYIRKVSTLACYVVSRLTSLASHMF